MTDDDLIEAARLARARAYAPYSRFAVGAALLDSNGRVFSGANIENISFGLTMCAERVALGSAVTAGAKRFEMVVLVADSEEPIVPCGACRQVLAEFAPELQILSATLKGKQERRALAVLLPLSRQGILEKVPHGT